MADLGEESGGKFCLVCFVHLFLFSLEILELFYVYNFFVNFVNTSSDWSKMPGFIFAFFFLWLLLSVMNFVTSFLLFLISMELRGKFHLSFNLVKTGDKHRISHRNTNLILATFLCIIFVLLIWPDYTIVKL